MTIMNSNDDIEKKKKEEAEEKLRYEQLDKLRMQKKSIGKDALSTLIAAIGYRSIDLDKGSIVFRFDEYTLRRAIAAAEKKKKEIPCLALED